MAALAFSALTAASGAHAQGTPDFPRTTIRIIVGFPPGGGADTVARAINTRLGQILGKPVIVENKTGANGRIGAEFVAKAAPDGHTILVSTEGALVTAPHMVRDMPYDPLKDLAPVSLLARTMPILVATPSLPASTVAEVIALARQKPGALQYASSGIGGPNHLAGELFRSMTGIDIVHVPFKGTGAAMPAVLSGDAPLMFAFVTSVAGQVQGKRLKAIAVAGAMRARRLPDVPTMAEAGVPGYEMTSFVGALAPPATPTAILTRLEASLVAVLRERDIEAALDNAGFDAAGSTQAEFRNMLVAEHAKYGKLLEKLDIRE